MARCAAPRRRGHGRTGRCVDGCIRRLVAWDAVAELPSAERDTLLLYVWEELSYEQIAAALDIPVGTVRSRLNRARARLRDASPTSERMEL